MKHFSLMLVMVLFTMSTVLAQRTVTGTVMLEGEPAIGANVVIDGDEGIGTVTEFDGTFSISVPGTAKALKISYTGAKTQTVSVEGVNEVSVTLLSDSELIAETIVLGYKVAKREELSSVPSVVGEEDIKAIPMATFDNIIQGRSAGVQISASSGQPGASAGKVQIRGTGSITGSNTPLYIMDGVPIPAGAFSTLNPADIETVTVLKDAAQTSIYGARGANGVIVITSKKGKFEQEKTTINYSTQFGWAVRSQESFDMMNSADKLAFEQYAGENGVVNAQGRPGFIFGSESSPSYDPTMIDSLSAINVDWSDVVFRTALQQRHELSLSGGSKKTRFYLSGQFFTQEGTTRASDFGRGTTRFNVEHKANDKLTIGLNMTAGYSKRSTIRSSGGVNLGNAFAAAYLNNSYETPLLEDGSYNFGMANPLNVVEIVETSFRNTDNLKTTANTFVEYEIIKGLTARTAWGIDYNQYTGETFIDPNSFDGGQEANGQQGSYGESYSRTTRWIGTNTLNYNNYFLEDKLRFNIMGGAEMTAEKYKGFSYTGYGLNEKLPGTPAAITGGNAENNFIANVGGSKQAESLASFFTRAEFGWDEKYNMSVGYRRDGSSKFGANNRWANFYSVGASWVLTNESFLKGKSDHLNYLKLFLSYGTSGNDALAPYQTLTQYGNGTYGSDQTILVGVISSPDLKWEVSNQLSFGLDFELLKNKLGGTLTFYNNITSDLLIDQSLPGSSGGTFGQLSKNSGKMRNRGVEIELDYDVITTKGGFNWNIYGNYAFNDNEVLDLGQVNEFEQGTSIVKEGIPIDSHFQVDWAGVDPATGQALYYDLNGNVTPTYTAANNTTNHGTINPPHLGGYGTVLSYKGIQISAFFNFMAGHRLFNNQTFFQENHNFAQFNQKTLVNDIWKNPGDITEVQGIIDPVTGGISVRQFSGKDIEDASFLRFRNLAVSYSLPSDLLGKVFSSVKISAQAQNLFTKTAFTGFDPEISNNIAQYEYPVPRIFTIGLDVGF